MIPALRMRFQRIGTKRHPFYRLVAAKNGGKRDGKFLEALGTYNPIPDRTGAKHIEIASDRVKHWLVRGAKPTSPMYKLLERTGMIPPRPVIPHYGPEQLKRMRVEKRLATRAAVQEQARAGKVVEHKPEGETALYADQVMKQIIRLERKYEVLFGENGQALKAKKEKETARAMKASSKSSVTEETSSTSAEKPNANEDLEKAESSEPSAEASSTPQKKSESEEASDSQKSPEKDNGLFNGITSFFRK